MKPAPFDYYAPTTIEEACTLLTEAGGGATVLAGGQTLMPLLALRMSQPFILVDINKIEALKGVMRADGATAVALGASIAARSVRGTRRIRAEEMYLAPYATALEPDELITAIEFPDWPRDAVPLFHEIAQRPGDFALVGLVGALAIENGHIRRAGIAWFGMGPTPIKARQAEAALIGKAVADLDVQRIAELAIADTAPFDDRHASAEYRRTVGRRILARTLGEALNKRQAA
jgi:carbon-monoxide dehydrogenase medium subunit